MTEFQGKVVLITGAGKGCGRLLAEAFAERGAVVAANDISPVNVDEVVNRIIQRGGRAQAYIEDVAKKLGAQLIINQVVEEFGRIDILINHAAVEPHIPVLQMDEWDWHRVLDVNLTGAFLMTQSVGRLMRLQGRGIIISLVGATEPEASNEAAFVASMDGLHAFTQQAARELAPYGIDVYAVESDPRDIIEKVFAFCTQGKEQR